jgi:3-hydroxy-9,10-secoandrosta-1,3,5(10)-triene-9,17-dione monooxygenase reductase component
MSTRDNDTIRSPNIGSKPTQVRDLRNALGMFATGVTIVTAGSMTGSPVGMTANSFSSVSLDPPLVLWGISKSARSFERFSSAPNWAVHVLSVEQETLARRFATQGADKFSGLSLAAGLGGIPLLDGCCARFECSAAAAHDAGDHVILVGAVERFSRGNMAPLVFRGGKFAIALDSTSGCWQLGGASARQEHL